MLKLAISSQVSNINHISLILLNIFHLLHLLQSTQFEPAWLITRVNATGNLIGWEVAQPTPIGYIKSTHFPFQRCVQSTFSGRCGLLPQVPAYCFLAEGSFAGHLRSLLAPCAAAALPASDTSGWYASESCFYPQRMATMRKRIVRRLFCLHLDPFPVKYQTQPSPMFRPKPQQRW